MTEPEQSYAIENDLSGYDWLQIAQSQFVGTMEQHEGQSFGFIFAHETLGFHGFMFHLMAGGLDLKISRKWWEKEDHHELDKKIWVERERPEDDSAGTHG